MFGATKTSLPSRFSFLIKIYVLFCQCFIHLFYSSRLGVALFWVQAMFQTDFQSNGDTHGEYIMRIRLHDLENSLVQYHIQKTQIRLKKNWKLKQVFSRRSSEKAEKGELYCITYIKTSLIKPLFVLFSLRFLSFSPFHIPKHIFLTTLSPSSLIISHFVSFTNSHRRVIIIITNA